MMHNALAPPGGDSGLKQLLPSGPGPGQDWTAWPGEATTCHAICSAGKADTMLPSRCEVAVAAMRVHLGGLTEDRIPPETEDKDKDKDSLYPGQLEAPHDITYTPGRKGRPWKEMWSHRTQRPGSQNPLPPVGVCLRHSSRATEAPTNPQIHTRFRLCLPGDGVCPHGSPMKDPEVRGERCVWSAPEKTAAWPPPPLIGVSQARRRANASLTPRARDLRARWRGAGDVWPPSTERLPSSAQTLSHPWGHVRFHAARPGTGLRRGPGAAP